MQVAVPQWSCMEAAAGAQDCWEWTSQGTHNPPTRVATLQPAIMVSPKRQSKLCVVNWAVEICKSIFSDENSTSCVCLLMRTTTMHASPATSYISEPWGIYKRRSKWYFKKWLQLRITKNDISAIVCYCSIFIHSRAYLHHLLLFSISAGWRMLHPLGESIDMHTVQQCVCAELLYY